MKIVSAKFPKSKAEEIRDAFEQICNKDEALFFEYPKDYRYALNVAARSGYKFKSECLERGGYKVWIYTK